MKKLIIGMAALLASALPAQAATWTNFSPISTVVTTTSSYVADLQSIGANSASFQVTIASATPQASTFTDGSVSSGNIIVASYSGLSAAASSDTITVSTNSALSATQGSDSILFSNVNGISGSSLTIVTSSSQTLVFGIQLSSQVSTSTGTAISIASSLNSLVENITATVSGSSVIVTCTQAGSFCNSYQLSSTTNTAVVASANFTGGNDNSSFTLTDPVRTWVFTQGTSWSQQSLSSNTALSIAGAINNSPDYFSASTNTSTSVLITLNKKKSSGNIWTLTASTAALSVASAKFIGGQDNAILCIGGTCLTQGTDFTALTSSAVTANSISGAINANAKLSTLVTSTAPLACGLATPCGIVYATGTIVTSGTNNYVLYTSTSALTLSSTTMLGGTTASYTINKPTISILNHTLATGEEVKFTSGTIALGGLTNQTSYYVSVIDANDIALALTSTGSFAGSSAYINLTSTSTTLTAHTFTLTPLSLVGTTALTWSESNDGVNFSSNTVTASNVTIPTNTLASPWALATYGYDFGPTAFRYLRLTVSGPSTVGNGGYATTITGYGKQ